MSDIKMLDNLEYDIKQSVNIIEVERDKIKDKLADLNELELEITDALELFEEGLDSLSQQI